MSKSFGRKINWFWITFVIAVGLYLIAYAKWGSQIEAWNLSFKPAQKIMIGGSVCIVIIILKSLLSIIKLYFISMFKKGGRKMWEKVKRLFDKCIVPILLISFGAVIGMGLMILQIGGSWEYRFQEYLKTSRQMIRPIIISNEIINHRHDGITGPVKEIIKE